MRRENFFTWVVLVAAVAFWAIDSTFDLNTLKMTRIAGLDRTLGFTEIRPLLQVYCASCHSGDQDWTKYEIAYKNRDAIRSRVWVLKNMPIGKNDMTNEERSWIRDWVDEGGKK